MLDHDLNDLKSQLVHRITSVRCGIAVAYGTDEVVSLRLTKVPTNAMESSVMSMVAGGVVVALRFVADED